MEGGIKETIDDYPLKRVRDRERERERLIDRYRER